ncbi:ninjurin 2 [Silurus meridionalis]|nr:ninjurin 2 [Silurus meridionalis]
MSISTLQNLVKNSTEKLETRWNDGGTRDSQRQPCRQPADKQTCSRDPSSINIINFFSRLSYRSSSVGSDHTDQPSLLTCINEPRTPTTLSPRLNINRYATKKTMAEGMLDVALLMANASQLKAVLEQEPGFKYYMTVIVLIAVSLFFQVLAGVFFILMARKDLNVVANQRKLDVMNNIATALVLFTVIVNIFITAFGVQKTGLYHRN